VEWKVSSISPLDVGWGLVIESLKYLMALEESLPVMGVDDGGLGLISFVGLGLNFPLDLVVELGLFWV
jgi:hypothetical protein